MQPLAPAHASIELIDTGVGMTPEVKARACEPFFSTRSGSAGLGLCTVLGFVTQSGGELTIDSSPGHGTKLTVEVASGDSHPSS